MDDAILEIHAKAFKFLNLDRASGKSKRLSQK